MKLLVKIITTTLLFSLSALAFAANPKVSIDTNLGEIVIELNAEKAPNTVKNFLSYVDAGFYENVIFHRVISNFMIQGGGFDTQLKKKSTQAPIKNEANNGLKNTRGTIAMARTGDPHSATAQFFINVVNNSNLDFKSESTYGWGYAVFGKVVTGMDVVDQIRHTRTVRNGMHQNLPAKPVIINTVTRLEEEPSAEPKTEEK